MSAGGDHSILSPRLIDSMRYGGYSNPATALAELVDNSVEAGATRVEILCRDRVVQSTSNVVERIGEIAVVDNGSGMSHGELWNSLRLGAGTRTARRGIGRFGMGLPYASISQCRRVDVYTWQAGGGPVITTRLDLDEIASRNASEIPMPAEARVPDAWADASAILPSDAGTVVVWSSLDRCMWKKSATIMKNSESIVGRTYRRFLDSGRLGIRMASVDAAGGAKDERNVLPNDPLYRMVPSSTPAPWDGKPMFHPDGERPEVVFDVPGSDGGVHQAVVRFAFADKGARADANGQPAGSLPHGRHASRNAGVSVVRADREIDLDQNLLLNYDPRERWWGAEIEFPPALDEFFGVTNNKQHATNFSTMAKIIGARHAEDSDADMPYDEVDDKIMSDIVKTLVKRIRRMREQIKRQEKNTRKKDVMRYPVDAASKRREEAGHESLTGSDRRTLRDAERSGALRRTLSDMLSGEELDAKVKDVIERQLQVDFERATLSGSQLFDLSLEGGVEVIKINMNHNAYKNFMALLDDFDEDIECSDAIRRLKSAQIGLLLLLGSWARYEDEEPNDQKRKELANIRFRWGEILDDYLRRPGAGGP